MAQNPRQFGMKHFNHPLAHVQVTDLGGFLFHFQARQSHFIKLNEASAGSFQIGIYKLPPVMTRREGDTPPHGIPGIPFQGEGVEQALWAVLGPPHHHLCDPVVPNFHLHPTKGMKMLHPS